MKRILLSLILLCSFALVESQTIFNPNDSVVTYNPAAPAGSQSNPNQAFGYNIIKWVRTVRMPYNTSRYKCYMIGNIPFRLRFPDSYNPAANDGKKYPIMLFFHGGGEATANTRDNEFHLLNGGSTFPEKIFYGTQDAFILFPQSRNVGWDNSYYTPMNIVIDSLIKNCKGDEDRVLSMGLSIGGFAAMDYSIQYPKRAAVIIPNSPVFLSGYAPSFGPAIQIPLWMGTGGLDTNPDPGSAEGFVNGYRALGGDLYWSYYPRQAHVMWDYQWAEEPTYSNRMATSHKANPMVYFNNRFFCPGSPVSSRMALTPGFFAYQWSKNDVTISGATSNEYIATDFGTYKARFKRTSTSDWSAWSLEPAVVVPICAPMVGTGTGLNGNYYNNTTLTPPVALNRLDPAMNFAFENGYIPGFGVNTTNYSTRWTGKIQPQFTETYTIYTKSDDGIRLWINGTLLIDNYVDHGVTENTANFAFTAGQKYDIKIEYYNRNGAGTMFLKWSSPNTVKQMVPTKQLYPEGTGDPAPPVCTTNLLPANNATLPIANSATLSWNPQALAGSYDVYLWTGATPPATPTANVSTTSYTANGLTPGNTYKWYIAPRNGTGVATGCAAANTSTFTINPFPPACVTNLTPANGSTTASATAASFTWDAAANATSYDIYIWTGATPPATPTANVTTPLYNVNNLLPSTVYFWYVVPKNISGPATDCNLYNKTAFTTAAGAPTVPVCVTNTTPANGTTIATQTTASLGWNTAATATSYDVYVWTGLTPPATPTANVATTSYNVSGLTPSTVYNWYVAPRNASGPATGCDVTNKTVFTTASVVIPIPGCANNTLPANGTTIGTQTTAGLTWSTVANATSYDVYLWTGAVVPTTPVANVTATNYNASGLVAGSLYNWFIVPKNASGAATGCDLSNKTTFTTASLPVPSCVTNTGPSNGANQGINSSVTLGWTTAAGATSYDVYIWSGAVAPSTPVANVSAPPYLATGLAQGTTYNWYIVPRNAGGPAVGCSANATSFTTNFPLPLCVTNTSPANGTVLATQTTATLTWPAAANATSYAVYLWTGPTPPALATATVTATSYNAISLTPGTVYNWYIMPINGTGGATGCEAANTTSFTTASVVAPVPSCATNTAPSNGTTIATQTNATLSWTAVPTATSYDVYVYTGATPPASPTTTVSVPTANVSALLAATSYNWYVVPKNASGPATSCDLTNKSTFTTAAVAIPVPDCAVNNTPANASTLLTQTTAALTWGSVAGATSYDVYLWTGATPPATPTANVTTTSYNASALTASTLYNWYIVPRNAGGPATGCDLTSKWTFTTAAIPVPLCVVNASPANGTTLATQTTAALTWAAAANATSYDVYLWTGAVVPTTPVANVTATNYNASGLVAGSLYNWFIVPKNASGAATGCDLSNKTTFTTASLPVPSCVTNTGPSNGANQGINSSVTLGWTTAAGATSYDVYIWSGAVAPSTPVANVSAPPYLATGLAQGTTYNWYIVPRNAGGPAVGCSANATSFTTNFPLPLCVTNTSPANGAVLATQTTANLTWPAAANATSYAVYLWTGPTPPALATATVTTTSYNASSLTPGTVYNWYIMPINGTGGATGCEAANTTSFTTASVVIPVPGCATNTAPANGATLATQTAASLTWSTVANATSYDVYLWTGATPPATPTANVGATNYNATTLLAGTLYNWYIVPRNASGVATGCDLTNKTTFTTAGNPVPPCVTNTLPANGAVLATQTTAALSWTAAATATSYDVYVWTGATPPATPTANAATTNYNATTLTAGTVYNWYIAPRNASGAATSCSVANRTTFTTAGSTPTPGLGTGLQGVYYNGTAFAGTPLLTRVDPTINFDLTYSSIPQRLSPAPGIVPEDNFSVRWTGQVKPLYSETYTFYTVSDDGIRLFVNGVQLVNNFVNQGATERSGTIALVAGQKYDIVIEYYEAAGEAVTRLLWSSASTPKAIVPQTQLFPPGFVDPTIPGCATNTAPANGSTIVTAATATLTWNAVPDATSYDVYIWTGATPPATPTANVTTLSYNASGLTSATLYNWYVVPKNVVGSATGCSANSTTFTTGAPAPACTSNLLPTNNAVLATANTAALSWTAAATATSYDVYIWTGATPPATPTANVATNSYNASGLTAASTYNWYVSPRNAGGAATGCTANTTAFVTASAPAPSCTINTSPGNGTTIVTPNTAALTWNTALNATSYDVYVFTGATPPATPTANTTLTSYNATGLTPSTAYNWFVIPKNAVGSATGCATSNRTSFTTGAPAAGTGLQGVYYNGTAFAGAPLLTRIDPVINFDLTYSSIPQRLSPAPGIVPEDNFSVRWTGQVKALYSETYTFYTLSDDGIRLFVNGVQLVNNFVNQGATERSGTIALVAGQKYDIVIEYYEAAGEATARLSWSSASTPKAVVPQAQLYPPGFVDPTIPGCATNTVPANGSTIVTAATATLGWSAAPDATSYDVYIWSGATPPATPTANVAATSYNATGLTAGTLYNWFVTPKNALGSATGCSANSFSFTTGAPAPACTNNLLPANNAVLGTPNTATLTWTAAATATSYDVYIWIGATPPATPTVNVATTSYNATGLTAGSTYNWYVSPKNAGGTATGCSTNKTVFVTAAAPIPACTINTSPANGSTLLTSNSAVLNWNAAINATSYDVFVYTGATPPVTPTANVTATTYNAGGLNIGTLYNWFVVPKNAAGSATGCGTSARTTFTTASAPDGTGLQGVYYNGTAFAGTPLLTRIDPTINFDLNYFGVLTPAPGIVPEDNYSVRWTGQVKALYSETYTFYTVSDDGIRLFVNGVQLVNNFVNQGATERSGTLTLVAGQKYDIVIEYYEATGEAVAKLFWSSPSTPKAIVPQVVLYPPAGAGLRVADPATTTTTALTTQAAALTANVLPALTSTVSPNPVRPGQTARLQITSDKTGAANITIISSNGFVISTQKANLVPGINNVTINTSALGLGFYVVNITGGSAPVNLKLMVE